MQQTADSLPPFPGGTDLSNWRSAPHSRRAFHHVAELLPLASVARGTHASKLSPASSTLAGFALQVPGGPVLGLDAFLSATSTNALVVLQDGQLVHEFYAQDMDAASRHILMSATKAVMGLLAGVLAANGVLDTQAPVIRYVPEVANGPYAGTTVRHLLDMRAGVVFDQVQQTAYDEATGWQPTASGAPSSGLHAFFAGLRGPALPQGGPFRYVSANTDLLGWVLERASGQALPSLLSQHLWVPLQAGQDAEITLDAQGSPRSTGGLCASARDLARIGQLLVEQGRCGGVQVIPATLVEDLAQRGDRAAWTAGEWGAAFAPISTAMSFRSGWYTVDSASPTLFAMGVYGQNLFIDLTQRIVMAKFSCWAEPTDYRALGLTHLAWNEIRRCLRDDATN